MRNRNLDWEDGGDYDYYPNELAELRKNNPILYREIVGSNLEDGDTIEDWQHRNLDRANEYLKDPSKAQRL